MTDQKKGINWALFLFSLLTFGYVGWLSFPPKSWIDWIPMLILSMICGGMFDGIKDESEGGYRGTMLLAGLFVLFGLLILYS